MMVSGTAMIELFLLLKLSEELCWEPTPCHLAITTLIIKDFKRAFKDVDVIVAASTPISALKLGEFTKYPFFGEMMDVLNEPAAIAGIPAISVPCGQDKNGYL